MRDGHLLSRPRLVSSTPRLRRWALPLVIVFLSAAYYLSFHDSFLNLTDEGFLVNGALRVLEGQVPLSDFYSYPPGRYYLLATLFVVFGVNLATERLMWVVLMTMRNVLVFTVSRRLLSPLAALAIALTVMLVPGAWYKTLSSLLMFIHLEFLFRYLEKPGAWGAVLAGSIAGLAVYFRQEYLLYSLLAGFVAVVAAHARGSSFSSLTSAPRALRARLLAIGKHTGLILAAAALCIMPLVLFYGLGGSLDIMVRRMAIPLASALGSERLTYDAFPFPSLSTLLEHLSGLTQHWPHEVNMQFANVWFAYLTLFILIAASFLAAYRLAGWLPTRAANATQASFLLVLLVWTGLTVLKVLQLPFFAYFLTVSQGILILAAFLMADLVAWVRSVARVPQRGSPMVLQRLARLSQVATVTILGSILIFSWLNMLLYGPRCDTCGAIPARRGDAVPLKVPRADLMLGPDQVSELESVILEIRERTSPDGTIFAFRRPMLYFLAERRNATALDWPTPPILSAREAADLVAAFREHPPALEIVHANGWLAFLLSQYPCEVQKALLDNYRIVARHGDYIILERNLGSDGWSLLRDEFTSRGLRLRPARDCHQ